MSFIQNLIPIFRKSRLKLIETHHEIGDMYSFVFEKPSNVSWIAGQHGVFTILSQNIEKSTRPFSIASSQRENRILITTHITKKPSDFKRALADLKPGMDIAMRGPVGGLFKNESRPKCFIAGGIGITPYRAILFDLAKSNELKHHEHRLIYIDRNEEFLYTKELGMFEVDSKFTVDYRKHKEAMVKPIQEFFDRYANEATYYVVGSRSFIESTEEILGQIGIIKANLRKDRFLGY